MQERLMSLPQTILLLASFLVPALTALAGDQDFSRLVKEIESHFHVKRTHIPLFGVTKPLVKIARPSGARSLELAIFEDQDFSSMVDSTEFGNLIQKTLSQEWRPLVHVHSRRDSEQTYIFAMEMGKDFKLIIVNLEPNEAVAMLARIQPKDLLKWLDEPGQMGKAIKTELDDAGQE